jgi:predicted NBD/HSP70 family sugar kinase
MAGICVGVPGLVNGDGVVRVAPNLDWHDVDVAGALRTAIAPVLLSGGPVPSSGDGAAADGLPLTVENEANLAALAELFHVSAPRAPFEPPDDPLARPRDLPGNADTRPSFVYISGEIGVGAGLVLEGRLLRGPRGYGGELGHVTIRPDGPPCRCGARGCLEAYTNQEALLRAANLSSSPRDDMDPLVRLRALAEGGDATVLRALTDAGTALGVAAADVINLVDVDTVVLGGVFAPLTPWLSGPVTREIEARTVTSAWAPVTVRAAALGTTATVIGAAGSVVRAIREAPATWLTHLANQTPDPART